MCRPLRWTLAVLFVGWMWSPPGALAAAAGDCEAPDQKAQSGDRKPEHGRTKWWQDAQWRAELGLSDKQSANIDRIFEVEMVKLRAMREELNKLEATLAQMVKADNASLAVLTENWERVGTLLSESYKTRQLMIFRIHRELSVEQRAKLQAMFDRLEANRRQGDPNRRR
jgi:hypothetical protein